MRRVANDMAFRVKRRCLNCLSHSFSTFAVVGVEPGLEAVARALAAQRARLVEFECSACAGRAGVVASVCPAQESEHGENLAAFG